MKKSEFLNERNFLIAKNLRPKGPILARVSWCRVEHVVLETPVKKVVVEELQNEIDSLG